jgi:hypothetical protein
MLFVLSFVIVNTDTTRSFRQKQMRVRDRTLRIVMNKGAARAA